MAAARLRAWRGRVPRTVSDGKKNVAVRPCEPDAGLCLDLCGIMGAVTYTTPWTDESARLE
jgi:hypothetical protein